MYALKLTDLRRLPPWSRQAAVREARVLAALADACPCLPAYREAFALPGPRLAIVSELAPGGDVGELLRCVLRRPLRRPQAGCLAGGAEAAGRAWCRAHAAPHPAVACSPYPCRCSRRALEEREVWSVLLQSALALAHLHAHRVLHRDVKPANVLLGAGGIVQLTDLGVCGQLSGVFSHKSGAGSPLFRAPEMWRGKPYSFSAGARQQCA